MFNTLFGHVCFPVSSEKTVATSYWWTEGGFERVIGRRGFHALVPLGEVEKRPLEPLLIAFLLPEENDWILLGVDSPH